jgi:hypothetical protein
VQDLAAAGDADALGGGFAGFQFGHGEASSLKWGCGLVPRAEL